ncbi:MAG TPA: FAD-binding protein, partial [Casimicrobium sp.]|nr:FAD-binding protein [Casimicrobium sp.]
MNRRDLLKNSMATVAAFSMASFSAVALAAAQNESQLRRRALRSLATSLAGKLLLPRDPQYRAAALSANARFDQVLPLAVAMCTSSSDVARRINWARKEGVALATKGGGHNYEGASSTAGLLINTRSMDRIRVDREAKTLVVGSGVLNGAILNELKTGNLMLPIGTCP